jgi:hypothetical protein
LSQTGVEGSDNLTQSTTNKKKRKKKKPKESEVQTQGITSNEDQVSSKISSRGGKAKNKLQYDQLKNLNSEDRCAYIELSDKPDSA